MGGDRLSDGMTRREALRWMGLGATALTLGGWSSGFAQPAADRLAAARIPARAKSVIQLWLWGGPPHTDTFDPKPDLSQDYTGPLNRAIPTNVPGIEVGQMLPQLAQMADRYSIIRSMTHGNNGHETAAYITQTGRRPGGGLVFPALGAIVSRYLGYDGGYEGLVPPYIVLTAPQGRFDEAGFLGVQYKPFATGGNPNAQRFVVEGVVSADVSEQRQISRRELLSSLDLLRQNLRDHPGAAALEEAEEGAYEMILGDAGRLFDLSTEESAVRDRYGRNTFGQSCLMARRLVGAGVPFVTINYGGWDTHKAHFETMRRKLPEMDTGMSALLEDLEAHDLLDSTVVWWSGEFGRTPKVDWQPPWNGGRHHFGACFSAVVAGGGFKGGRVVGASNETGERVAQRPVAPADLLGSICELMGIDPEAALPNPRGLDLQIMPSDGETEGRLSEIM